MAIKKRPATIVVLFLCTALLLSLTASAAYYNTYTSINPQIASPEGCTGMQGFDVGSTYCYSVKVNTGSLTKAVIYRTKLSDGSTTLMTNGDNGLSYCTYLSHANDMVLCTINDEYYMFIVTMLEGSMSLVKLKYVGTTYYKVGNYTIKLSGQNQLMSGVKITGKTATTINFLFKNGKTYYRGSLPLTANTGTINVTEAFTLNTVDALVNGSTVPGIETFANQGFEYYNNSVYHPVTKGNVSIVLVYRNIPTASGTITADPNLSFRVTSVDFPKLFEIEGCGHGPDGKLYFNTNRNKADGTAYDGVHYFNNYVG